MWVLWERVCWIKGGAVGGGEIFGKRSGVIKLFLSNGGLGDLVLEMGVL